MAGSAIDKAEIPPDKLAAKLSGCPGIFRLQPPDSIPETHNPVSCSNPSGTEGGEAGVLMKHIDLGKADFPQQVQLKNQRPRRILLLDVGKDVIPVDIILY
jgi:hypothetical protein